MARAVIHVRIITNMLGRLNERRQRMTPKKHLEEFHVEEGKMTSRRSRKREEKEHVPPAEDPAYQVVERQLKKKLQDMVKQ